VSDTAVIFSIIGRDLTGPAIGKAGSAFNKLALGMAASAAFFGVKALDAAADLETAMTRVQTGAGEAETNIRADMNGILQMMGEVGASAQDLAQGLYTVNSAGFHGAEGLAVLKIAAMGAKVGAADMHTTVDALTTALNAYGLGSDHAAAAMNALVAAEGQGKTNLEALAGSLSAVVPAAAAAHVGLNDVLAAMATMTAQGTPAAAAATYLKQAIGALASGGGSARAQKVLQGLGVDTIKLGQTLGSGPGGLAKSLQMVTDAIQAHMGPNGIVLVQGMQKAASSTNDFQKILANLPPAQMTYLQALAKSMGGMKSLQAVLELTGGHMATFKENMDVIYTKVGESGDAIEGWAAVQQTFNQRMAETKGTLEAVGIRIGNFLLPYAQKVLIVVQSMVNWFAKHTTVAKVLAGTIGVLGTAFVLYRAYALAAAKATEIWKLLTVEWAVQTKIATAAQWLFNFAMDANPIGLIIIAIAALAAGFYLLWTHSKGFRDFFIGMWSHIWGFMKAVGAWFAGPFAHFFVELGKQLAAPFVWLWHTILEPFAHAAVAYIKWVWNIYSSIFHLIADLIMMYLVPAFMTVWHAVIEPFARATAAYFTWLWGIVMTVWHGIADGAIWLYQTVLTPIGHGIATVVGWVGDGFTWLWHQVIEPAVHGIAAAATWVYDTVIKPVWSAIMTATHWLGDGISAVFSSIGSFIAGAFHQAVNTAKGAINALISVVNGAIRGIDTILSKANSLPGVNFPMIPQIPHLAAGGIVQVGEHGTEIVRLPSGSAVYPHGSVPADMAGGGGRRMELGVRPGADAAVGTLLQTLFRRGLVQVYVDGQPVTVSA
jgi:TP901 family phage tail tape measure protein